jgi:hypothetical protein
VYSSLRGEDPNSDEAESRLLIQVVYTKNKKPGNPDPCTCTGIHAEFVGNVFLQLELDGIRVILVEEGCMGSEDRLNFHK